MAAQAKKKETNGEVVGIAAKAALKKAAGDVRNAAILMEQGAKKNPALYRALTEPYLGDACWQAVRGAAQSQRKRIWSAAAPTDPINPNAVGTKFGNSGAEEQRDRVIALARGNVLTLLDFPLPIQGLPRLGDANLVMLKQAADAYSKQAADMGTKAEWLSLIIGKMPDEKATVSSVFDDAALRKLQAKAGVHAE